MDEHTEEFSRREVMARIVALIASRGDWDDLNDHDQQWMRAMATLLYDTAQGQDYDVLARRASELVSMFRANR